MLCRWRLKSHYDSHSPILKLNSKILPRASDNRLGWTAIFDGELQSAIGKECPITMEEFQLPEPRSERFIYFVVKSFFGLGGGLQYVEFSMGKLIIVMTTYTVPNLVAKYKGFRQNGRN